MLDEKMLKIGTVELPIERLGEALIMILEIKNPVAQDFQIREIVGGENFSLDDRKVDFDLVEPTGVDRTVDQMEVGMAVAQSFDGGWSAMGRAVVDDPENPAGLLVGRLRHNLIDKLVEGLDSTFLVEMTEDSGVMDIHGSYVGPGAATSILVLDLHGRARAWGNRGVYARSRLDTGLFVRRQDKLIFPKRSALPCALVKIQDPPGLLGEQRVSGEYPAAMLPGAYGVFMEPSPDGDVADRGLQSAVANMTREFGNAPARDGHAKFVRQFTGDGLDPYDQLWGEKPGGGPGEGSLRALPGAAQRISFATCSLPPGGYSNMRRSGRCLVPRRQAKSSLREGLGNTVTYTWRQLCGVHDLLPEIELCDMDWNGAWTGTSRHQSAPVSHPVQEIC